MLLHLSSPARSVISEYRSSTKGDSVGREAPLWHRCAHALGFNNYNAHAVSVPAAAMYVKTHVNGREKPVLDQMIARIRSNFQSVVKEADWMDQETRLAEFSKTSLKR